MGKQVSTLRLPQRTLQPAVTSPAFSINIRSEIAPNCHFRTCANPAGRAPTICGSWLRRTPCASVLKLPLRPGQPCVTCKNTNPFIATEYLSTAYLFGKQQWQRFDSVAGRRSTVSVPYEKAYTTSASRANLQLQRGWWRSRSVFRHAQLRQHRSRLTVMLDCEKGQDGTCLHVR